MKRFISFLMVAAATLLAVACDDRSSVPQAVLDQASKPPENTLRAPTTQELLSGHRSRTALHPLPLTMELPPGWHPMKELANVLQGYTPTGDIQIQLVGRASMKKEALERTVLGAKKEMATNPTEILKVDLRSLGNVKVLERQKVGKPAPLEIRDKNNQVHTSIETPFTWTLDVLVPFEDAYQVFELNFLDLTKRQFDQDKDFLNGVLSTLAYAGEASSTNPTAASSSAATQPATSAPPSPPSIP
jgi:hypothetical protein